MEDIKRFVEEAKGKGLEDDKIRQLLSENGWSPGQIDAALLGLEVPKAPVAHQPEAVVPPSIYPTATAGSAQTATPVAGVPTAQSHTIGRPQAGSHPVRPSIHPLEAALQHILLWVFTFTSSIMIGVVTAAVFGAGTGSSEPLLTYLVLELVTFVPFAVIFVLYLRKFRKNPELTTGKVWSIITIVFHSLGTMGALITLLLGVILVPSDSGGRAPVIIAGTAIGVMDAIVLVAYVLANFTKGIYSPIRRWVLFALPAVLFTIIAVFGVIALVNVGPLRADDQTRKQLVDATKAVKIYVTDHRALPESLSQTNTKTDQVEYSVKTSGTYQLCANFKHQNRSPYTTDVNEFQDAYVSKYEFESVRKGRNCWTIQSSVLYTTTSTPMNKYGTPATTQAP